MQISPAAAGLRAAARPQARRSVRVQANAKVLQASDKVQLGDLKVSSASNKDASLSVEVLWQLPT